MSPFTVRASKSNSANISTQLKEKIEAEDTNKVSSNEKVPAWTIEGITQNNLEPSVTLAEHKEYKR